ncbi:hypothetical protein OU994_11900 [Pseudoduganella sp. SL102]|uniref:hypothetical protein n=1 Tax=Pseudoduganella sp. SL102 TaxID=2995154 RepID=UPI00248B1A89|nr:hypothetical protein [Pseudoduganella sp. SL102]WBS04922.1 hypothetical protein OU994_11900 [Pseudoduganella sp. SL102]
MNDKNEVPNELPAANRTRLRGWGDAEQQMCAGIAALGQLAGVDVGLGRGPADMDALLVEAAYQCYFNDPEFMDGPCCFGFVKSATDIDILKLQADAVVQGLVAYIRKRGDGAAVREAEVHVAMIDATFAWLKKARREAKSWPMDGSALIRRRPVPVATPDR